MRLWKGPTSGSEVGLSLFVPGGGSVRAVGGASAIVALAWAAFSRPIIADAAQVALFGGYVRSDPAASGFARDEYAASYSPGAGVGLAFSLVPGISTELQALYFERAFVDDINGAVAISTGELAVVSWLGSWAGFSLGGGIYGARGFGGVRNSAGTRSALEAYGFGLTDFGWLAALRSEWMLSTSLGWFVQARYARGFTDVSRFGSGTSIRHVDISAWTGLSFRP